jgi:predicted RNA binding protein YcfA (HicA-like mRNA interferase family)
MPKLRSLSARELFAILATFGFEEVGRKGSHVKLRRVSDSGERETLIVPDHKTLDRGTTRAILRQASRYVPLSELHLHFYTTD